MATIRREDALKLFAEARTADQLEQLIRKNCHLWFDEDQTLHMLKRCARDAVSKNTTLGFGTLLMGRDGPFQLTWMINEKGEVRQN